MDGEKKSPALLFEAKNLLRIFGNKRGIPTIVIIPTYNIR